MINEFIHSVTLPDGSTRPLDAVEEAAYYCEKIWREGGGGPSDTVEPNLLSSTSYPMWRRADDILWDLVGGASAKYRAAVEWAETNYANITPAYCLPDSLPQHSDAEPAP